MTTPSAPINTLAKTPVRFTVQTVGKWITGIAVIVIPAFIFLKNQLLNKNESVSFSADTDSSSTSSVTLPSPLSSPGNEEPSAPSTEQLLFENDHFDQDYATYKKNLQEYLKTLTHDKAIQILLRYRSCDGATFDNSSNEMIYRSYCNTNNPLYKVAILKQYFQNIAPFLETFVEEEPSEPSMPPIPCTMTEVKEFDEPPINIETLKSYFEWGVYTGIGLQISQILKTRSTPSFLLFLSTVALWGITKSRSLLQLITEELHKWSKWVSPHFTLIEGVLFYVLISHFKNQVNQYTTITEFKQKNPLGLALYMGGFAAATMSTVLEKLFWPIRKTLLPPSVFPSDPLPTSSAPTPTISFCHRLTTKHTTIKREGVISSLKSILQQTSYANPLIVGPAGMGKSTLIESIAESLDNTEIWSLQIADFMKGTEHHGKIQEHLATLVQNIQKYERVTKKQVIIFIDEVHTLVSMGKTESHSSSIADYLKAYLERGEIKIIGATTEEEVHLIQKDTAFHQRFSRFNIPCMTQEEIVEVLQKARDHLLETKGLFLTDDMLTLILNFSNHFFLEEKQPRKAVKLLEHVIASLEERALFSFTQQIDSLEGNLEKAQKDFQLEITQQGRTNIVASLSNQIQIIQHSIAEKKQALHAYKAQLERRKMRAHQKRIAEEDVESLKKIDPLLAQSLRSAFIERISSPPDTCTTSDEVEEIICHHYKLSPCDLDFNRLDTSLLEYLAPIQPRATRSFISKLEGNKYNPMHPLSFFFVGPKGTGKTDFALVLSEAMYFQYSIDKRYLLDLSSCQYREQLTNTSIPHPFIEFIRKGSSGIVILENIEMTSPQILAFFTEIIETGKITYQNQTIDCSKFIFIFSMTTNISPSREKEASPSAQFFEENKVQTALEETIHRPFMNLMQDRMILFDAISAEQAQEGLIVLVKNRIRQFLGNDIIDIQLDATGMSSFDALFAQYYDPQEGLRSTAKIWNRFILPQLNTQIDAILQLKKRRLQAIEQRPAAGVGLEPLGPLPPLSPEEEAAMKTIHLQLPEISSSVKASETDTEEDSTALSYNRPLSFLQSLWESMQLADG